MDTELAKIALYSFTTLAGLAVLCLAATVAIAFWTARPHEPMAFTRLVGEGNGLRVATVLCLVVGVVYLGLLGAVKESAIAAILSGVAGYVLGGWNSGRSEDRATGPAGTSEDQQ
jgi:hypothetical protein